MIIRQIPRATSSEVSLEILAHVKFHPIIFSIWLSISESSGEITSVNEISRRTELITKHNVFPNPVGKKPRQFLP